MKEADGRLIKPDSELNQVSTCFYKSYIQGMNLKKKEKKKKLLSSYLRM